MGGPYDIWRLSGHAESETTDEVRETPGSCYTSSRRDMPAVLPAAEYPGHFEERFVSRAGVIKWKRQQIFVSCALAHEWLGFEEIADGVWSLHFYDVLLGRLDERNFKLRT